MKRTEMRKQKWLQLKDEEAEMIQLLTGNDMSSHVAVFPHCAPSLNMADRRSVQEFVQNVINLQTRSNQRGNNEESSRAEFESITDKVNAQFQIPRQGSQGWRTATPTTSTLCQLLLSIPSRTVLFNRPEGVLEGEQETLHQLQESDNQTSCIKIFACFPIPNTIRCHKELRRQIWSSLVSTWTHLSWTRPWVRLAFMWNWRPCSKKPWDALVLMTLGKQLTFYSVVCSLPSRRVFSEGIDIHCTVFSYGCTSPCASTHLRPGLDRCLVLLEEFHSSLRHVHHQWCH